MPNNDAPDTLAQTVECLLFAHGEPLTVREMAKAANVPAEQIESALPRLRQRLTASSGLQLVEIANGWQLATRADFADAVTRLLTPNIHKLSRTLLETATIVAYKQPCTQSEIEAVRGVVCHAPLKTLEERGFVAVVGRKTTPGRPILYGTTDFFLHHFGLRSLADLPKPPDEEQSALPFEADAALGAAGMEARGAEQNVMGTSP